MAVGTGLAGAYFARTNLTLAKVSRVDSTINFDWANGTPSSKLGNDGFSARWTGQVLAKYSETYTFKTQSQGGVRLWVNNTLIIDAWTNHSLRQDVGSIKLTGGKKFSIRLEYFNNGDSPQIELDWQSKKQSFGVVPKNRLFASALDSIAPTTPPHLRPISSTSNSIQLDWDSSSDPSGVVTYDVYVGSTKVLSTAPGVTNYTQSGLQPSTGYTFSVRAIDAGGRASTAATTAVVTSAPPNTPPTTPTGLNFTGRDEDSITLSWNPSSDNVGVASYRIYRNGVKLPIAIIGTTFTDTGLNAGTQYSYTVQAVDGAGAMSNKSGSLNVSTLDEPSHNAFSTINAVDYDEASGGINTSGNAITDLDNGEWVRFRNVQFGAGANSVLFNIGLHPANRGGAIELRLGSLDGVIIGTHNVQATGSFSTYYNQMMNIAHVTGTHDLYLVFKNRGDVAQLRSFTFSPNHLTRIMPLGDSITHAFNNTPSYRYYLWHRLLDAGFNVDFVGSDDEAVNGSPTELDFDQNHEGHTGKRADEIAAMAHGWAVQANPEIVLLHIGTNDLIAGQSVSSTLSEIEDIIEELREAVPNVTILLAQILPLNNKQSEVDDLNDGIAALAQSLTTSESPIVVVDQNSEFTVNNDLSDGIHPTSAAESKMADNWYDALASLLQ